MDVLSLVLLVFFLVFISIIGFILYLVIRSFVYRIAEKRFNDSQPISNVAAKLVAKRTRLSGGSGDSAVFTLYFVTFENAETGERTEFHVTGEEYGLIADGDSGHLTYQGRRYLGFARNKELM